MAVVKVFESPVNVKYRSHVFSKASFISWFAFLIKLIVPLLIAFASGDFWQREASYREQPNVRFKHELLAIVQTNMSGDYVTWSTYDNYNQLQMENLRIMVVKSREEDLNSDGLNDVLNLQLDVPLLDTESVLGVELLVFFDYRLYTYSQLQMEGMAYIQHASPIAGAQLTVAGDLALHQKELLRHKGLDARYNVPIIQNSSVYAEAFELSTIFNSYVLRNVSTQYMNQYPVWSPQRATGQPFVVKATVNYPEQRVLYEPGLWQMLKWGLVQYVAVFLPLAYLVNAVLNYFFTNQKVSTRVHSPWDKMKQS